MVGSKQTVNFGMERSPAICRRGIPLPLEFLLESFAIASTKPTITWLCQFLSASGLLSLVSWTNTQHEKYRTPPFEWRSGVIDYDRVSFPAALSAMAAAKFHQPSHHVECSATARLEFSSPPDSAPNASAPPSSWSRISSYPTISMVMSLCWLIV